MRGREVVGRGEEVLLLEADVRRDGVGEPKATRGDAHEAGVV